LFFFLHVRGVFKCFFVDGELDVFEIFVLDMGAGMVRADEKLKQQNKRKY
jgi:hypothetical protein